ncbi:purine nucleoside permease, partial [Pseudomonas syringae pv. tagetis]
TQALLSPGNRADTAPIKPYTTKVMLVDLFAREAQNWKDRQHLTKEIHETSQAADNPPNRCNEHDDCLIVNVMRETNDAEAT